MPNWCENTLTVTGEENEVQLFKDLAKPKDQKMDSELSFESLYPIADKNDWYHWCIAHWGTKWDVEATLDELSPDYLEYPRFKGLWHHMLNFSVKPIVSKAYDDMAPG